MSTTSVARPVGPPAFAAPPRWRRRLFHATLGATWVAIALPLLVWGLEYYLTPLSARPGHPGEDLFSPTGLVGNRLGVFGTALLAFGVTVYMLRKRWGRLQGLGRLRDWLSFHIWCCTLGPFLVLLHTSFKVGGLVSIAFWSMVTVVASGVLGRYVYVHIPKALNGRFLAQQEIEAEREALDAELAALGVEPPSVEAEQAGFVGAFGAAFRAGRRGRQSARHLSRALREAGVPPAQRRHALALARRSRRLAVGRAVLAPFGRVFRYWHAIHLPLAIVMALILAVHIAVAILFGYAWT